MAEQDPREAEEQARAQEESEQETTRGGVKVAGRPRYPGVGGSVDEEDRTSGPTHVDDATYEGGTRPGDASERSGPEDALGVGKKRGDYELSDGYEPHEVVAVDPAKDPLGRSAVSVPQRPRMEDTGDAKGKKGGVETATPEAVAKEAEKVAKESAPDSDSE